MTGESISSEGITAVQQRHLQGEGAALAFEPQPMDVDVRVDAHRALSAPVVATIEMGDNHFLVVDQVDQLSDPNGDRYAVLNAFIKTDKDGKQFYTPTVSFGTLGANNNRLEFGRTDLQQRGFSQINDTMSRRHAAIELHADGFVVRNQNETNGTDINFTGRELPAEDVTIPRAELDRLRGTLVSDAVQEPVSTPDASKWWEVPQPVVPNADVAAEEPWYVEAAREREQAAGEVAEELGDVAMDHVVEAAPEASEVVHAAEEPWYVEAAREREQEAAVVEEVGEVAVEEVVEEPSVEEPSVETPSVEEPSAEEPSEAVVETQQEPADEVSQEVAAEEPEFVVPSTQEVFKNSESIEKTLRDPNIDPATKTELQGVLRAWHELQSADVITNAWEQAIRPQLQHLKEAAPALLQTIDHADQLRNQLQNGLLQVRDVLGNRGGISEVADILGRVRLSDTMNELGEATRILEANGDLQSALSQLANGAEEADMQIRAAQQKESISEENADAFRAQFADGIQASVPMSTLRSELEQALSERRTPVWSRQKNMIDEVMMATRRAANAGDTAKAFMRLRQDIEALGDSARRGYYNEAEFDQAARGSAMSALAEELEFIHNVLLRANNSTEELLN